VKTYSPDIFHVEGFLYKDQLDELFTVMVFVCIPNTYNIVNFLINFTVLLQHTFQRHDVAYLC